MDALNESLIPARRASIIRTICIAGRSHKGRPGQGETRMAAGHGKYPEALLP